MKNYEELKSFVGKYQRFPKSTEGNLVDGVIHNEKCTNWGNYPMIAGFCWIK